MKTFRSYFFIIIALLLCTIFLTSCTNQSSLTLYKAYRFDFDNDEYQNFPYQQASATCKLPQTKHWTKELEKDTQIILNGTPVPLTYKDSYTRKYCEENIDSYRNDSYLMWVDFYSKTGKIASFTPGEYVYPVSVTPIESKEQLITACNSFVLQYVDSIADYSVNISTVIFDSGMSFEPEFIPPASLADANFEYFVEYVYQIDGFDTMDTISIYVEPDGRLNSIYIKETDRFKNFQSLKIDKERCESILKEEVETICTVEGYQFIDYESSSFLVVVDNVLGMLYRVTPTFTSDADGGAAVTGPQLEFFIPVAKG